jgi:hypothetical protein
LSVSTIFNHSILKLLQSTLWLPVLILLSACGAKQVVVEGQFPSPLMNRQPLTLGVWYVDEFANHEFFDETKSRQESDWIVKTGEAQVQMWDTLLGGMFENLVHMHAKPGRDTFNQVVDAVLIPHVEELQYAIPTQTHIKVYEIWMRYRFELVTTGGDPIAEWTMTAYGKTPTAFLQSDEAAVNLAAVMALRDAGANFAISFARVPDVDQWLQQKRGGPEMPDHE